ncbi:MAG: UDP-N-acetylmuramoyl-L-alanyl-D-glutamate--2,6-diaminopimelate ligase [Bacteroidetes bacterium]|nr:MAG: UDP-N-acetylmuramoyl-L-alanyl-D-glutamate--2,6-diaminopimelate ligase [Bacteroidota bacterium]
MLLNNILYGVPLQAVAGNMDIVVSNLVFDSRLVAKDDVFVAVIGTLVDGHEYIDKAIDSGAMAIVCSKLPKDLAKGITYVEVTDSAEALGIMAANFYGKPSERLKLVGVTGTNGKTTIATLLHNLYQSAGYASGLLSTINNKIGDQEYPSTHTTPDALQLNKMLAEMVETGCAYCFMEVSSHALSQHRTAGLTFSGAIFTNLSHDHLDYHQTFDAYIKAKKTLFDNLPKTAFALVNSDDKRGKVMLQNTKAEKHFYSLRSAAEFRAKIISNNLDGLELDVDSMQVWFRIFGEFNAYNLMAVYGTAVLLGMEGSEALTLMSDLQPAPGRLEQVRNSLGLTALVDYAHTPDALTKVLETINDFRSGNEQLITVVGCGGDRDKEKRPQMASIACQFSEKVILTSDNPRSENPEKIIDEMMAGIGPTLKRKTIRITNREEAIKTACLMAQEKDIILVAGKGHENYQEIKGERFPFDDREVLTRNLTLTNN